MDFYEGVKHEAHYHQLLQDKDTAGYSRRRTAKRVQASIGYNDEPRQQDTTRGDPRSYLHLHQKPDTRCPWPNRAIAAWRLPGGMAMMPNSSDYIRAFRLYHSTPTVPDLSVPMSSMYNQARSKGPRAQPGPGCCRRAPPSPVSPMIPL
jgi:hypothetical protein